VECVAARPVRMACLAAYLCLIVAVCLRDTFSIFATSPTIFPAAMNEFWDAGEQSAAALLGERLDHSNWIRNAVMDYLQTTGNEDVYGFFDQNVPSNYKLVFELSYPDGHIEYDIPRVSSSAVGLRFAGLLDQLAEVNYAPLRATMMKIVTYSVWQEHPKASAIRAYFGRARLPAPAEFERGDKGSYDLLFTYNFTLGGKQLKPRTP
jgi:hypothetical protein